MAEKSSRPAVEANNEEDEGEEAAEVPPRQAPVKKKDEQKAAIVDALSLKEEKTSAQATKQKTAIVDPKSVKEESKTQATKQKAAIVDPKSVKAQPAPHSSKPAAPVSPSTTAGVNVFANDGSFLELFKKKMEASTTGSKEDSKPEPDKRKPISFVGKRRGGAKLALKTGMVAKKPKAEEEEEVMTQKGGAWAQYMAEVKKYKAHQCSDDDKTRPLVK